VVEENSLETAGAPVSRVDKKRPGRTGALKFGSRFGDALSLEPDEQGGCKGRGLNIQGGRSNNSTSHNQAFITQMNALMDLRVCHSQIV